MTSVFSWQTLLTLALLHFVLQGQLSLFLQVSLDFLLCIPVPYNENDIFWGCQFQKVLQVFTELFNFSFFTITGQGIELDYCDSESFALEMNRDHSVLLRLHPSTVLWTFVDYESYSISSKGFLEVVDIVAHSSRYNGHLN